MPAAASRKGLAPAQRPVQPPVDPRLRPWYERCRSDSVRLATVAGQHSTTYALKALNGRVDATALRVAKLEQLVAALATELADARARLATIPWQPPLIPPEQAKLPESRPRVPGTKSGAKPVAAV